MVSHKPISIVYSEVLHYISALSGTGINKIKVAARLMASFFHYSLQNAPNGPKFAFLITNNFFGLPVTWQHDEFDYFETINLIRLLFAVINLFMTGVYNRVWHFIFGCLHALLKSSNLFKLEVFCQLSFLSRMGLHWFCILSFHIYHRRHYLNCYHFLIITPCNFVLY